MKKMIIILACILFLTGCKEDTIDIGIILTLSGPDSEIGVAARNGIILKVNEINDTGGIDGKMVVTHIRDDKGDAGLIKAYSIELYEEGMDVFIGFELSSKFQHIDALLKEDVIVISPTISDYKLSGIDDNFFRTNSTNYDQGSLLGIHANKSSQNTLILYDNDNSVYAEGIIEGFLDEYNGNYSINAVANPIHDSEEELLDIVKSDTFDSVLLVFNPSETAMVSQIFYKNNLSYNLFSSNWGMVSDSHLSGGKAMEGIIFSTYIGEKTDAIYNEFVDHYMNNFNEKPGSISVYAYEAALLYFESIRQSDSMDLDDVRTSLINLRDVQGVVTKFSFDQYGDIKRENIVTQIIDGELIRIGE